MNETKVENVKRILCSAWQYKREKEHFDELIEKAISSAIKVTPSYSLAPGGGNPLEDKMAEFAGEIESLEHLRNEKARQYLRAFREVSDLIDRLGNPIYIAVLRRRYLGGYKWEQVADEMCLSLRRITQIHHEAIEALAEVL